MGFDCPLNFAYKFAYKTVFSNNLVEHELDHVFLGEYNGDFNPNPAEVSECRWVKIGDLRKEMKENPDNFTFWFQLIIQEHLKGFQFPKK
jgi:isopentenyl-diphosphate delta-isomerase